jgi:hypothetical protein|tara:strand:+ start:45 stop:434 length:390 start_codon:yes stop_codon:yes gene_type:complete
LEEDKIIKKETNMKINKANKQHIHDALITDMQKRLREDGRGTVYTNDTELEYQLESLVVTIEHTNTISDINDVVIEYGELFNEPMTVDTNIFTLEGTMNYVLNLALDFLVVDDSIRKLLNNISPTPRNL